MAADNDELTITFEGATYRLEDFELGELEWLEDELGIYFNEIGVDPEATRTVQSMKAATRLVYVLKRRENPEYTLEDARKVKLEAFETPAEENGNGAKAKARPTKRAAKAR